MVCRLLRLARRGSGVNRPGYAVGVVDPTRRDVESRWQPLIDGILTREDVHAWAAPWEGSEQDLDDAIVELGLLHLYGFDLSHRGPGDTSNVLQQHGGGPGRVYLRSVADIATELDQWRRDVDAFDDDPAEWRRDRLRDLHRSMLREGRFPEADRVGGLHARETLPRRSALAIQSAGLIEIRQPR